MAGRYELPKCSSLTQNRLKHVEHLLDRSVFPITRKLIDRRDQRASLVQFTIFQKIDQATKDELVSQVASSSFGSRAIGSLVGLAIGDWVGVPLEFLEVVDNPDGSHPRWDSASFCYRNLPPVKEAERGEMHPGQWSDDTSMALCLADSLIVNKRHEGSDVRIRYWNWQAEGLNNCFRNDTKRKRRVSFGLGYNIASSLLCLEPGQIPSDCFRSNTEDSGNGSLMRLAPIPIFFNVIEGQNELLENAALSSLATHPGALASESCQFWAYLVSQAIYGSSSPSSDIKDFLDKNIQNYIKLLESRKSDIFGKDYDPKTYNAMMELLTSSPLSRYVPT